MHNWWSYGTTDSDIWKSIYALQIMKGINVDKSSLSITTLVYKACMEGKQYASKWGYNEKKLATRLLEIVHSGVVAP
jgi:hypothetical protein